ncbi:acyltransferase [Phytoactinopolyspora halotolerans]|uniref:Acyltransferase n=2 Tax=Phytoactinopolyspora halotolerans TaxID=1981512 RepID=A0A6L9SGT9_9ACTN|nr:acyltransferase [Phytoactinopolyspora halotolerans]
MTAGRAERTEAPLHGRRPELDALRALVVLGLVFFHAALVFDAEDDFYVKNADTTEAVTIIAGFAVVWAMPMLFLISGLGAWYSISHRGPGGFVKERLLRLGVPLAFAFVALLPIAPWVRQRDEPGGVDGYLAFWPRFFDVHVDLGELPFVLQGDHFESGHLWFVVLLLVFSLMLTVSVRWLPLDVTRRIGDSAAASAARRTGVVLLPALAFALLSGWAGMEDDYAGWNRWAYLLFFLFGFALAGDERFRAAMRRDAGLAAALGGVLFVAVLPGMLLADEPFTDMTPLAISTRAAFGAAGWCWVVAILGLLDRRRTRSVAAAPDGRLGAPPSATGLGRRTYAYLATALLPLYILHQPIVVGVASGLVRIEAPIVVKYIVIVVASYTIMLAVYELFVRRWWVARILFGMRP